MTKSKLIDRAIAYHDSHETAYSVPPDEIAPVAWLNVTKLVRESVPIKKAEFGGTIGQALDEYIAQAIDNGEELQEVTLGFSPEQWVEMRNARHRR